ncbi:PRC-barrel domain-containing protein [Pelagibacterium limicola]|uniref:PRC-barrel domain-containing protein n=1 Tax=Pelagibacterium limicola TaxID=2791022 RepID=UPI0018AFE1D4|nr:PRC-barrel domain-containing protein [Pelagibacterium limicola]
MPHISLLALAAATSMMFTGGAIAQETTQDTAPPDPTQETAPVQTLPAEGQPDPLAQTEGQADQCRQNMAAFATQLNEDQFWISGWAGMPGYGFTDTTAPVAETPAVTGEPGLAGMGQWEQRGYESPRRQIQVLHAAAQVFAAQNNQEACDYVLGQLASTYERYRTDLADAGVQPVEITDWRREQIALAEGVQDIGTLNRFTANTLIGADVRTRADENLGSVNDVIVDPESGEISYLIVARGGFFGFGEELTAVPWQAFAATPDLGTLVLDIEPALLEGAPTTDSTFWTQQESYQGLIEQTNQYWQIQ